MYYHAFPENNGLGRDVPCKSIHCIHETSTPTQHPLRPAPPHRYPGLGARKQLAPFPTKQIHYGYPEFSTIRIICPLNLRADGSKRRLLYDCNFDFVNTEVRIIIYFENERALSEKITTVASLDPCQSCVYHCLPSASIFSFRKNAEAKEKIHQKPSFQSKFNFFDNNVEQSCVRVINALKLRKMQKQRNRKPAWHMGVNHCHCTELEVSIQSSFFQYLVCPPFAARQCCKRRGMDITRRRICCCGMLFQWYWRAAIRSPLV